MSKVIENPFYKELVNPRLGENHQIHIFNPNNPKHTSSKEIEIKDLGLHRVFLTFVLELKNTQEIPGKVLRRER